MSEGNPRPLVGHTPGPWVWRNKSGSLHAAGTTPYTYGECILAPTCDYDAGADIDVSEANAALIAAAPDMLELLLWLDRKGGLGLDVHDKISAVISKAQLQGN